MPHWNLHISTTFRLLCSRNCYTSFTISPSLSTFNKHAHIYTSCYSYAILLYHTRRHHGHLVSLPVPNEKSKIYSQLPSTSAALHNNALCIDIVGKTEVYNPEATKKLCTEYGGDVIFVSRGEHDLNDCRLILFEVRKRHSSLLLCQRNHRRWCCKC